MAGATSAPGTGERGLGLDVPQRRNCVVEVQHGFGEDLPGCSGAARRRGICAHSISLYQHGRFLGFTVHGPHSTLLIRWWTRTLLLLLPRGQRPQHLFVHRRCLASCLLSMLGCLSATSSWQLPRWSIRDILSFFELSFLNATHLLSASVRCITRVDNGVFFMNQWPPPLLILSTPVFIRCQSTTEEQPTFIVMVRAGISCRYRFQYVQHRVVVSSLAPRDDSLRSTTLLLYTC